MDQSFSFFDGKRSKLVLEFVKIFALILLFVALLSGIK